MPNFREDVMDNLTGQESFPFLSCKEFKMARDSSPVFSGAGEKGLDCAAVLAAVPAELAALGLAPAGKAVLGPAPAGKAVLDLGRVEMAVLGLALAEMAVLGLVPAGMAALGLVLAGEAGGWEVQEDEGCMNCRYRRAASIGNGKFDRT